MLNTVISITLASLALLMGYLGIQVALNPPYAVPKKNRYKTSFLTISLLSFCLVVAQAIMNSSAQSDLQADAKEARRQAQEAREEAKQISSKLAKVQRDHEIESERRQQAERDLGFIVQFTAKETRSGVASDIRKSPLKVDVSELKQPPKLTSANRLPLEPDESPPYRAKYLLTVDQVVTPFRVVVICNKPFTQAGGWVVGTSVQTGGGGRLSERSWAISVSSPAWTPKNPLLVTITAEQRDLGGCGFALQ